MVLQSLILRNVVMWVSIACTSWRRLDIYIYLWVHVCLCSNGTLKIDIYVNRSSIPITHTFVILFSKRNLYWIQYNFSVHNCWTEFDKNCSLNWQICSGINISQYISVRVTPLNRMHLRGKINVLNVFLQFRKKLRIILKL